MGELRMRLQEAHQLHETNANELRLLHIQNKNLESEKVYLAHYSMTLQICDGCRITFSTFDFSSC